MEHKREKNGWSGHHRPFHDRWIGIQSTYNNKIRPIRLPERRILHFSGDGSNQITS